MFELKKSIEELCLMTLKIDATLDRKMASTLKNDMRNLDPSTQESQKVAL